MSIKSLLKSRLSLRNYERARIVGRCLRDLSRTFRSTGQGLGQSAVPVLNGYPVPLDAIRGALAELGIGQGDTLLVHSSVTALSRAWPRASAQTPTSPLVYAEKVVELLLETVGAAGTLCMPTEGLTDVFAAWRNKQVFDPAQTPSTRGLITELFRRRGDVTRSVHPWYNLAGCGPRAESFIAEHARSTPYTMDRHSPWYKLTEARAKVLMLGLTLDYNSLLHLPEYLHADEYPRPIYYNKPLTLHYRDRDATVRPIDVMIHVVQWRQGQAERFCEYLNKKYALYQAVALGGTQAIAYPAREQYRALCDEMRQDVCWYDAQYW